MADPGHSKQSIGAPPVTLPRLWAELRRRNVIRVAGLYLVGAWLIVQVAATVLPLFEAPPGLARAVVILLLLGFVPALALAWAFELTPEGLKRDADVAPKQSIAPLTARRLDRLIIAILSLALTWFGLDRFVLTPQRAAAVLAPVAVQPVGAVAPATAGPRSIAVLPFVNMSAAADNDFFSDGLSEEILNSLARIDGMQVVGRTSSFQFKGKNEDLRAIGGKLGVANVLEGSVRRNGERARINAQLVRTADGMHLWSQAYDRTVDDALAVQLDIAEHVAGALNVMLDDHQRARMREAGVQDVDAFIAYQKGLKLYVDAHERETSRDIVEGLRLANVEFAKATMLEPDFSLAYYAASDLYAHLLLADGRRASERAEAQREGMRILALGAASSSDPHQRLLMLADRQLLSDDWHGLSGRIDAALREPGCNTPTWLPVFASVFGYGDRIEELGARLAACDPLNLINLGTRTTAALASGQPQRVLAILAAAEKAQVGGAALRTRRKVQALVMLGRIAEAQALLATAEPIGENYYVTQLIVGTAAGESAASLHSRLASMDRASVLKLWGLVDVVEAALSGDRAEANRRAAALDARPGSGLALALVAADCLCGAPFDLDATPNFKTRLAEAGLPWPPPAVIRFPPRRAAAALRATNAVPGL